MIAAKRFANSTEFKFVVGVMEFCGAGQNCAVEFPGKGKK
jgi:hypothetical protein